MTSKVFWAFRRGIAVLVGAGICVGGIASGVGGVGTAGAKVGGGIGVGLAGGLAGGLTNGLLQADGIKITIRIAIIQGRGLILRIIDDFGWMEMGWLAKP